jgi:lipoyl(octanoyl) transferase
VQAPAAGQTLALRRLGLMEYQAAWDLQGQLVGERQQGTIPDTLLLLQHPHTYTLGRRATPDHLLLNERQLNERGVAVHWVDRGGDITYHGPGQIVGYPIIDLRTNHLDVHQYLRALEEVLIRTLAQFGIEATRDPSYTGVWVPQPPPPSVILSEAKNLEGGPGFAAAKIAAIGVKVSRGVTSHGFALNVNTDLTYFEGIVPCGITDRSVTSMAALKGHEVNLGEVEDAISTAFQAVLG